MSDTDRAAQIGRKIAHQYGHVTMGPELETELSGDIAAALRSYGDCLLEEAVAAVEPYASSHRAKEAIRSLKSKPESKEPT